MLDQPFIVYWPDGRCKMHACQLPDSMAPNFLKALHEVVDPYIGKPLERVNVFHDFDGDGELRYRDMFVNENGHLDRLPLNRAATAIYQHNVIHHEPGTAPQTLPVIVGTAVLFRNRIWK
jgi:hypothetical protein